MCQFCVDDRTKMREYGRQFGYPKCCIEEFVRDADTINTSGKDPRSMVQAAIGNETGYIPCKACAVKLALGEKELKDLINNRDESLPPFPDA